MLTAVTTGFDVPAQGGSPARLDGCHQAVLMPGQGMLCAELLAVGTEDLSHLEGGRGHGGLWWTPKTRHENGDCLSVEG